MYNIPCKNSNFYPSEKIVLPYVELNKNHGNNQILHYITANRDVNEHVSTSKYIKNFLQNSQSFDCDADILTYALTKIDNVPDRLILEFGVCTGKTINIIAAYNSHSIIHGFDSFQGLPEDWREGAAKHTFKLSSSELPPLLANVFIHVGWFEDTLPKFTPLVKNQLISFLHIDCDLYSSTKSIFKYLKNNIVPGTIILFDDYFNYNEWEDHEHKAFMEFIEDSNLSFEYLAYNKFHEQVLVMIK